MRLFGVLCAPDLPGLAGLSGLAVLLLGLLLVPGCRPPGRSAMAADEALPRYTPDEAVLFDDSVASEVLSSTAWLPGDKLQERIERADSVVVAKIITIARAEGTGRDAALVLELSAVAPPLAGRPIQGALHFELAPDSPAYKLFRFRARSLLGKRLVLLFRRYAGRSGVEKHFRAEPDIPAVHAAILQAK